MPKPKSLTVDLKHAESFLQIFPRSPLQVSDPTIWQGIFLAHHRQPAWEMPENRPSQHILSINIGAASKVERVIAGRLQQERFLTGNTAIYPAINLAIFDLASRLPSSPNPFSHKRRRGARFKVPRPFWERDLG